MAEESKTIKTTCVCGKEVPKEKLEEINKAYETVINGYQTSYPPECDCKSRPMGVSEWANHGKKNGYWSYFEKEVRKETAEEIIKEIEVFTFARTTQLNPLKPVAEDFMRYNVHQLNELLTTLRKSFRTDKNKNE